LAPTRNSCKDTQEKRGRIYDPVQRLDTLNLQNILNVKRKLLGIEI